MLGRTNRKFPPIWLSLLVPEQGQTQALVEAALDARTVIDISSQPALWGGFLRGTAAELMAVASTNLVNATSHDHAADMVQGDLIQLLSCIGREYIDLYFLPIQRRLEEHQISGALEALEMNKQEGLIRHLGLAGMGSVPAVLSTWQFHDAFDVILLPRNPIEHDLFDALQGLAADRRVGVVTSRPLDWGLGAPFTVFPDSSDVASGLLAQYSAQHPVLVGVRSMEQIVVAASSLDFSGNLEQSVEEFKIKYQSADAWEVFAADPRPWVKRAAQRSKLERVH